MIWWAQTQIRGGFASLGSLGLGVHTEVCWRTWVMLFTCVELLLIYVCMCIYIYIYMSFFMQRDFMKVCPFVNFIYWLTMFGCELYGECTVVVLMEQLWRKQTLRPLQPLSLLPSQVYHRGYVFRICLYCYY